MPATASALTRTWLLPRKKQDIVDIEVGEHVLAWDEETDSVGSYAEQHLYQIDVLDTTTGATDVFKYGVSGGKTLSSGLSQRAETQVRRLNRKGGNLIYSSQIIDYARNRRHILKLERDSVTKYFLEHGFKPRGNPHPEPWD